MHRNKSLCGIASGEETVLRWCLNPDSDSDDVTSASRLFRVRSAATWNWKARSPTVESSLSRSSAQTSGVIRKSTSPHGG